MRYKPEEYHFDTGDVVMATEFYQVAVRLGHDKWASSRLEGGNQLIYNDATILKWIKNGHWRWVANRHKVYEDLSREE